MYKRFSTHIRQTRRAAGLSQQAVADQVGVSRAYLTEVEGCTEIPSPSTVQAICRALDLPTHSPAAAAVEGLAIKEARRRGVGVQEAYDAHINELRTLLINYETQKASH